METIVVPMNPTPVRFSALQNRVRVRTIKVRLVKMAVVYVTRLKADQFVEQ